MSRISFLQFIFLLSIIPGSSSHDSLPTVDISYCSDEHTNDIREECYSAIDRALQTYGTFIAIGHGIKPKLSEQSFSSAEKLFHLHLDDKQNVSMNGLKGTFGRGYLPFGSEAGVSTYFEVKEGYSYGFPRSDKRAMNNSMESDNIWPPQLEQQDVAQLETGFLEQLRITKIVLSALIKKAEREGVRADLLNALAPLNEEDQQQAHRKISNDGDSISLMRLFHYFSPDSQIDQVSMTTSITGDRERSPVSELETSGVEEKVNIGSSPHTDWGLLTVIMQDQTGGLEFFHDNIWKAVPTVSKGLIINAGDYLSILSQGRYHSPIHRVLCPPAGRERTSFVFFYYPGFHSSLTLKHGSNEKTNRESTTHKQDHASTLKYNTFLQDDFKKDAVLGEIQSVRTITFGDYILKKWRGVTVEKDLELSTP